MKKITLLGIIIASTMVFVSFNWKGDTKTPELIKNIEALAANVTTTDLSCEGKTGTCSQNCTHCGMNWSAPGSHMSGSHKCSQSTTK